MKFDLVIYNEVDKHTEKSNPIIENRSDIEIEILNIYEIHVFKYFYYEEPLLDFSASTAYEKNKKPFLFIPSSYWVFKDNNLTIHVTDQPYYNCFELKSNKFMKSLPLLKSKDKFKEYDVICQKICEEMNWNYIPVTKHNFF